ncbi:Conserved_hypothetical protein [Hexamita inflata]|uniref:Uncharacterized protein n=1 Tax=Hexamita inflata TaxID=28002 RepID=A0AA86UJD8_9EUKA|nr:Conserved hypothetical protein [Hexamita inflata]
MQLSILKANQNQLENVDELIGLKDIEEISLINNKITDLKGLQNITYLKEINLNYNHLYSLKGLPNYSTLRSLQIIENPGIKSLDGLDYLPNLQYLSIQNCKLTSLEHISERLPNVTMLALYGNELQSLIDLRNLKYLQNLYAEHNLIENLDGLQNLNQLTYVKISNNKLVTLKHMEFSNTQIIGLDISYNNIKSLDGLQHIPTLKRLEANNNNISCLFYIQYNYILEFINLDVNNIIDLRQLLFLQKLAKLSYIWLTNVGQHGNPICDDLIYSQYATKVLPHVETFQYVIDDDHGVYYYNSAFYNEDRFDESVINIETELTEELVELLKKQ